MIHGGITEDVGSAGTAPVTRTTVSPRARSRATLTGDPAAAVAIELSDRQSALGRCEHCGGGISCRLTRRQRNLGGVLVDLKARDRCGIGGAEIVPRPASPEARTGDDLGVANQSSVHTADALVEQRLRPVIQCLFVRVTDPKAGIARAAQHEIAMEHAIGIDRAGRHDRGLEREVPTEAFRSYGECHEFHVRRRHHQRVSAIAEQPIAAGERLH